MEAQSRVFRLSSPSPAKNPKLPLFHTHNSSFIPSNIQSPKWVSLKTQFSLASLSSSPKKGSSTSCVKAVETQTLSTPRNDSNTTIRKKNLAVFVSGGGSNFRSIHEAAAQGTVHGEVVVLVTNKPAENTSFSSLTIETMTVLFSPEDCGGADYARDRGIPVIVFPKPKNSDEGFSPEDLVAALRTYNVDFILLAGYLKLIPPKLIRAYPRSILNIHPSLLPAFGGKGYYGMTVHKAVIASGARYSGPTIHYVDEEYDTGRILAQRVVPVLANDTAEELAARVLHEEHKLYVEVAAALCEERIVWRDDGVPLIQNKENPNQYT